METKDNAWKRRDRIPAGAPVAGVARGMIARRAQESDSSQVTALLESEGLETAFEADEFFLLLEGDRVLACARLKPLGQKEWELASVAVEPGARNEGLGAIVVREALATARGTVYALALAPGFFEKQGFVRIEAVPRALEAKARSHCASRGFVAMALKR